MTQEIHHFDCPGCGAHLSLEYKKCDFCGNPVIITTWGSMQGMTLPDLNKYAGTYRKTLDKHPGNKDISLSLAMCYLKLKLYDKASAAFDQCIESNIDNADAFLYASIALLKGKKAFVALRKDIDRILEYMQAALLTEPKGIYHYFMAYIKYDYFHRKYLNIKPNYREEISTATTYGFSAVDAAQLFALLGVEAPPQLNI